MTEFQTAVRRIARLTDGNDHTAAIVAGCELLMTLTLPDSDRYNRLSVLADEAKIIAERTEEVGYNPNPNRTRGIYDEMMLIAREEITGEKDFNNFYMSF